MYQKMIRRKARSFIIDRRKGNNTMFLFMISTHSGMINHSLNRGRKHFRRYCLHYFLTEEILKRFIKDCF